MKSASGLNHPSWKLLLDKCLKGADVSGTLIGLQEGAELARKLVALGSHSWTLLVKVSNVSQKNIGKMGYVPQAVVGNLGCVFPEYPFWAGCWLAFWFETIPEGSSYRIRSSVNVLHPERTCKAASWQKSLLKTHVPVLLSISVTKMAMGQCTDIVRMSLKKYRLRAAIYTAVGPETIARRENKTRKHPNAK